MILEIVLSQIHAWNNGDLTKLMTFYSDKIEVYKQPENTLVFGSKSDVINHIKSDFENGTVHKVRIVSKEEVPPKVILVEEKIIDNSPKRAQVTYLVENGKIQKMWILPLK